VITLTIPGSAVKPLNLAASAVKPTSHRGRLAARLDKAETKQFGRGQSHFVEVPDGLVKELRTWVTDAKSFASGNTEREAVRRLRLTVEELTSA